MSQSADAETLNFYRREAERYCQRTGFSPSAGLPPFLARLKSGASILELGCGSGRDTLEMLRQSNAVQARDMMEPRSLGLIVPPGSEPTTGEAIERK
jgi:2-polyprenyl-3-methyl-5-hydroxy-6-metoxy-1,4-benzoquinol methylase